MSASPSNLTRVSEVIKSQKLTDFGLTKGQVEATQSFKGIEKNVSNENDQKIGQQNWVSRLANADSQERGL